MSDIPFVLHLGGGLYMDSTGSLHQEPPPNTPVYEAPFKLPVDPKKIKDVLSDVKEALKDIDKKPDVVEKLTEFLGDAAAAARVLGILAGVAKIAGAVAPVFAVLGFAADVAKFFGLLKDGPNALEELVKQRFDELDKTVKAISDLIQTKDLRNGRIALEDFSSAVRNYVTTLEYTNPTLTQLENDRNMLLGQHGMHDDGIALLLDKQTWMTLFDRKSHLSVWAGITQVVHAQPLAVGAAPVHVPLPPDGSVHFDHRLMVPLASWAAETYLLCIRGIEPEYRSTGLFRDNVFNFAKKIDALAQGMREHVLARTVYKAEHFAWPVAIPPYYIDWVKTQVDGVFEAVTETPTISPRCNLWAVGALDLRYHDDDFFRPLFDALWKAEYFGWPQSTKHGGMDVRWIPPATLEPDPFGKMKITNPEACAAAANAQSEQDFADLLALSGYTELLQLAALFRHESTAPDRSQTVSGYKPMLFREPQPKVTVQVSSEPIVFKGVITSNATREPQKCSAVVAINTQPIKRARPMEYQIALRTLHSIRDGKFWREPAYKSFHSPEYEADPANPGFLRLVVREQPGMSLSRRALIDTWTSSPRDRAIHLEGDIQMTAHTFDWWIPVKLPFSLAVDFDAIAADLRGAGWQGGMVATRKPVPVGAFAQIPAPGPMTLLSDEGLGLLPKAAWEGLIPEDYLQQQGQTWEGEHREPKQESITLRYQLDWQADQLHVRLWNDLEDRNYVVFVVVEEKLPVSGQILHTAFPVPMNGSLTYVPQKFFDDERAAWKSAEAMVKFFNNKYIEVAPIGPADPVLAAWRPGDFASRDSIERFLRRAEEQEPELLREAMAAVRHEADTAAT
jgi:hypothetical protein